MIFHHYFALTLCQEVHAGSFLSLLDDIIFRHDLYSLKYPDYEVDSIDLRAKYRHLTDAAEKYLLSDLKSEAG